MAAARKLSVEIVGNAKGAQKAFGDLERAAGKSGKKTESALSKANTALLGFGAGAAIYGAFSAFDDAQKVTAQTEAVLKSTGGAANVTAGEIENLAGSLSKKSGVDDEAIQSGENLLLTFKNIRNEAGEGNDVFDQTTKAALDMSVAMGTDMKSASMLLGKALNDPVAGLAKLTKVGVTFTEQQKDQIRALAASGDELGAQKIILQELNTEFGGSAEAQATALGKAKVSVDNMAESVGGALAPALETAASAIGFVADGFSSLPSSAQTAIVTVTGITTAAVIAVPKIIDMADTLRDGAVAARDWSRGVNASGNLSRFTTGLATASAGIGAFTATLAALEAFSASNTDMEGLGTDLSQLATGAADLSVVSETLGTDVEGLSEAFRKGSNAPKNWKEALSRTAQGITGDDFLSTGLRKAQNRIEDLDDALATAVKSGHAEDARVAYGKLALEMNKQGIYAEDVASQMPKYWTEVERAGRASSTTAGSVGDAAAALRDMGDKSEDAGRKSHDSAVSVKENADALAEIREQATKATAAISEFYDEQTGAVSTQIDAERALDAVAQSFKDNGDSLNIDTEKGRQNREAIIAAKDAQLEYAMTLRDTSGTGAAIESMVQYSGKLAETLRASGLTEEQTAALIAEMGLTPTQIYTEFKSNATEAETKSKAVRTSIENVPGWKNIYFNAMTEDALEQIRILGTVVDPLIGSVLSGTAGAAIQQSQAAHRPPGKAKGGTVRRGSLYEVNEEGRELFQPGVTGRIIPADLSRSLMGGMAGGGVTNYITIRIEANARPDRELVSAITAAVEKGTRTSGRSPFTTSLSRLSRG